MNTRLLYVALFACSLLSVGVIATKSVCAEKRCAISQSPGEWLLKNDHMSVAISKATGEMSFIKNGNCNVLASPAYAVVVDKVSGTTFKDRDMRICESTIAKDNDNVQLTIRKWYRKDYAITARYVLDGSSVRVDSEVLCNSATPRELNILYRFPIASKKFEKVFLPTTGAPFDIRKLNNKAFTYRYEVIVPEVTVYGSSKHSAVSFVAPVGFPKPGLAYEWGGSYPNNTLSVKSFHLASGGGKTARASTYILCTENDWRPALGWIVSKYPKYFRPFNSLTPKGEGPMALMFSGTPDAQLSRYASQGIRWIEQIYTFPFYGLYVPERDSWGIVADRDHVSLGQWESGDYNGVQIFGKEGIRKNIARAANCGIAVYQYFQVFEAWHQYAEKYYLADIAKDKYGKPHSAWAYCNLMNPRPSGKWGQYVRKQLNELLTAYPGIAGIFWDRLDYVNYDFAHDDGVTMQGAKPCYQLGFACEKALADIVPVVHKKGLGIWGNSVSSVEGMRGLDGAMVETADPYAETSQYIGMARPVVCLSYDKDPKSTENKLQLCLLCGFFPGVSEEQWPREERSRELERDYKAMIDMLNGREWVLTANALTLPRQVRGNIFKTKKNEYLVTVVSPDASALGVQAPPGVSVPVTIRVDGAGKIRRCYWLSTDKSDHTVLPFTRANDREIRVVIPSHRVSSMLVFSQTVR